MPKYKKREVRELFANVQPHKRGRAHGMVIDHAIQLVEAAMGDPELSAVEKMRVVKDMMAICKDIAVIHKTVTEEEAIASKVLGALTLNVGGVGGAPLGCPPHVVAVWARFMAGDEEATRIVQKWIESADAAASRSGNRES